MSYKYDDTNPNDILKYSEKLIDKTFMQLINEAEADPCSFVSENYTDYLGTHKNLLNKGSLGEVVEECFFEYKANSSPLPDFPNAGLELKVSPFKRNKNRTYSAKERLVICMIDYKALVNEPFFESHFWNKSKQILLIYYLYMPEKARLDYTIEYSTIFTPPKKDLPTIIKDYHLIQNKVKQGKAHELSSSDTLYIEATTKGADGSKRREQPFSSIPAKPRAFAYKQSYMTIILNNYIRPKKKMYDSILPDNVNMDIETYVVNQINIYIGYDTTALAHKFGIDISKDPKNIAALVTYPILGVKSNQAEEFVKANIAVKTIRIETNGTIEQHMSFPIMDYLEVASSNWEDSEFYEYISSTRFLFVVYKYDEQDNLILRGCQFWNIPYADLEDHVRKVWEKTKTVLNEGLQVRPSGNRRFTNFPAASEDPVCHVRPHATKTSKPAPLPTPTSQGETSYTKHCFWLNREYILAQVKKFST